MAYTTIDKPTHYFNTVLYTGNGSNGHAITGVGFQPDWVWIKGRSVAENHNVYDVVRGAGERLIPNGTNAETTKTDTHKSFDSDGFTLDLGAEVNDNSQTFASWNWKAGGSASSNSNGSITSSVSANTTAGFSIVSYTGTGANATVGHGLSSAPACYVVKSRDTAYDWRMYHQGIGETKYLNLNQTIAAVTASNAWNDTAPTSSVFSLGSGSTVNQSGDDFIAYCKKKKKGFSKFGKFTSNNSDNGTFAYTGFSPAWVMMKPNVSDTWSDWYIFDSKRDPHNLTDLDLKANESAVENNDGSNYAQIDMLSNGFKIRRDANWGLGGSGTEVIYMAFAESPFVTSTGIPTTAR